MVTSVSENISASMLISRWKMPFCFVGPTEFFSTIVTQVRTTGQRASAHRSKPSDLLSNMTPLEAVGTTVSCIGKSHVNYTSSYVCKVNGVNTTLPYSWDEYSYFMTSVGGYHNFYYDDILDYPPWQNAMRAKLKSRRLNVGEDLFEWKSTMKMLAQGRSALLKALRQSISGRRGRKRQLNLREAAKKIANADLLIEYGINPLLDTAFKGAQRIAEHVGATRLVRFSTSDSASKTLRHELANGGYWTCVVSGRRTTTMWYRIEASESPLTVGNPLELAWNLLPYSFIADWLLGVGDYLSSLDAANGLTFVGGTQTIRETRQVSFMSLGTPSSIADYPSTSWQKTHERTVVSGLPGAEFQLLKPQDLTWSKVRQSLALIGKLIL